MTEITLEVARKALLEMEYCKKSKKSTAQCNFVFMCSFFEVFIREKGE